MEGRTFEVTLISAHNLPDVRSVGRMKVYAEVSLNGKSKTTQRTTVDDDGELNPTWNYRASYTVTESAIQQLGTNIVVKLLCKRSVGDKFIGEVSIPVKSLFDVGLKAENTLSYSVEGTPKGVLNISYSFGEKILVPKDSAWVKVMESGISGLVEGVVGALLGG